MGEPHCCSKTTTLWVGYDGLMEIYEDPSYTGTTGTATRAEAQGLATGVSKAEKNVF